MSRFRVGSPEARWRGQQGGLRSGQARAAKARQRAVQAARAVLREAAPGQLETALVALYQRAYDTGWAAGYQQRRRQEVA